MFTFIFYEILIHEDDVFSYYRVKGYSNEVGAMGYYSEAFADGSQPAVFYANVYRPDTKLVSAEFGTASYMNIKLKR